MEEECREEQQLELESIQATINTKNEEFNFLDDKNYLNGYSIKLSPVSSGTTHDLVVSLIVKPPKLYPREESLGDHIDFKFITGVEKYSAVVNVASLNNLSQEGILEQLKQICSEHKGEMTVWYLLEYIRSANYEIMNVNEEGLFGVLSEDILVVLFQYFDLEDLLQINSVNKLWNRLSKDKSIWMSHIKSHFKIWGTEYFKKIRSPASDEEDWREYYLRLRSKLCSNFGLEWPAACVVTQDIEEQYVPKDWRENTLLSLRVSWDVDPVAPEHTQEPKPQESTQAQGQPQKNPYFEKFLKNAKMYKLAIGYNHHYEAIFLGFNESKTLFSGNKWWRDSQDNLKACEWVHDQPLGVMIWRPVVSAGYGRGALPERIASSMKGCIVRLDYPKQYYLRLVYRDIAEDLDLFYRGHMYRRTRLWMTDEPTSVYFKTLQKEVLDAMNQVLVAKKKRRASSINTNWQFMHGEITENVYKRLKHIPFYYWVLLWDDLFAICP